MRPVSVHRTFPVEVRFEATNGSIPYCHRAHEGRMDARQTAVVPFQALIPNGSYYSELDTKRYVCILEGCPVCLCHRSCRGYKAQPGLQPLHWERRGRRGRRVNDLIEIWGGFQQLDESSKALMAEKQGFHLECGRRPLTNLTYAVTRTFSLLINGKCNYTPTAKQGAQRSTALGADRIHDYSNVRNTIEI